jgi:hypothetical protein
LGFGSRSSLGGPVAIPHTRAGCYVCSMKTNGVPT